LLTGPGLGVEVRHAVLERWAERVVDLERHPPGFVCTDDALGTRHAHKAGRP
jgi:hypothetical protein